MDTLYNSDPALSLLSHHVQFSLRPINASNTLKHKPNRVIFLQADKLQGSDVALVDIKC
jgi:hypothetical protein